MNHVIPDDIAVLSDLHLNAVIATAAGTPKMVNVVIIDVAVGDWARIVVATEIHSFIGASPLIS
jgi:hypothetical protein